jgi:hypothetical protein
MPQFLEYRAQTVLAFLQTAIVIGGAFGTTLMLKVAGYPSAIRPWAPIAIFVRDWGFVLLAIPALWVLCTVIMERNYPGWFSKRWTIASGLMVLAVLAYLLLATAVSPVGGTIIQSAE